MASELDISAMKVVHNGSGGTANGISSSSSTSACDKPSSMGAIADTNGGDDDDDDISDGWDEQPEDEVNVLCLFCEEKPLLSAFIAHCSCAHSVDLVQLMTTPDVSSYDFIQLVNFVRSHRTSAQCVSSLKQADWRHERYLKPVLQDDALLMLDMDDFTQIEADADQHLARAAGGDGDVVQLSVVEYRQLTGQLNRLQQTADSQARQLQLMADDMQLMRSTMREVLASGGGDDAEASSAVRDSGDGDGYFQSYAHFSIHHEMLTDRVRTESYRNAICDNAETSVCGKRVLDVGCGSGILSMFCARAGAERVLAVDRSDVVFSAMEVVRENHLERVVEMKHGRVEDLTREEDGQFDVIVSEWMGYFLLFEGMLDSVVWARDHLLAEGGVMMPSRCSMHLQAVSDPERYAQLVEVWHDVYGFSMSCLRRQTLLEAAVETVPAEKTCSDPCRLRTLDLNTIKVEDTEFTAGFSLEVTRSCSVTALAGYFDTDFELPRPVRFSTGPQATPTHWKQTVFYLHQPISAKQGDVIQGSLFCGRDRKDTRSLRVTLTVNGRSTKYTLA